MSEKREQPKYCRPVSLNEVERKMKVDYLNSENKLLLDRLTNVAPVIKNSVFQEDFKKHLKTESVLRRRQMKPLSVPKDMYKSSATTFDSQSYLLQKGSSIDNNSSEQLAKAPIQSMKEFREQVISTKKRNILSQGSHSLHIGESKLSMDSLSKDITSPPAHFDLSIYNQRVQKDTSVDRNNALFEMTHIG